MVRLSPKRNTSKASDLRGLVEEQLEHFAIDPSTPFGQSVAGVAQNLYAASADVESLWKATLDELSSLDGGDRIARFNAKKFLSFQVAKLLDNLQNPSRSSYQSLGYSPATQLAKGPYPIFDNITAIFSATPVIARTATYIYACAEWIEDAFRGKELMLEIYSRLLNPTSISLANYIVDIEAGPHAAQYMAWNFNSGMAAIDATLAHVLGRDDILITSRNIYGGAFQLIHDWYAKPGNLDIAVETFDGFDETGLDEAWQIVQTKYSERLEKGRRAYLYLESPCNPHGYVLDVPRLCRRAHDLGMRVILDATVGTPFLTRPLQHPDLHCRPDFLIHSYTKDLSGAGSVIAGCVIGRNVDMFIPKGESMEGRSWEETLFWNVYYVKGAFLNADAAFEVIQGMRTLEVRMLRKCINTQILANFLSSHPSVAVRCNSLPGNENYSIRKDQTYLGLPAPLFTVDLGDIQREAFQRFFDALSPTFEHMISLGQSNTIISCPALTTHSELNAAALHASGLTATTIRIAVGDEDPYDLIRHWVRAAETCIDPMVPGFSSLFASGENLDACVRECYLTAHSQYIEDCIQKAKSQC
jgi:O-acetylhomoserine (thiol)-lyase